MHGLRLGRYRGKWAAIWRDGGGATRRRSLGTEDRDLAERRFALFQQANRPARRTAAEIFAAYCADLAARGKSAARARDAWKALAPVFGHLEPAQIDRPRCRAYASQRRRQGRQDGTVCKELDLLRSALNWHDKGHGARIETPPRPAPRDRHLSRAEYARLRLAAKAAPHLYLFVVLGLATAARKRALLELTWDRVDFKRRRILLAAPPPPRPEGAAPPARKRRAELPMTRHARRVLRLFARLALTDRVIEYAGRPVGRLDKAFARAAARAGLGPDVTPHVLRHSAAVWMAEEGVPLAAIAQFLGHGDSRITERVYARFSPDYLARAARALE